VADLVKILAVFQPPRLDLLTTPALGDNSEKTNRTQRQFGSDATPATTYPGQAGRTGCRRLFRRNLGFCFCFVLVVCSISGKHNFN
jgi:hypothetical protein